MAAALASATLAALPASAQESPRGDCPRAERCVGTGPLSGALAGGARTERPLARRAVDDRSGSARPVPRGGRALFGGSRPPVISGQFGAMN